MSAGEDPLRLERVALVRSAERDRAAVTLERAIEALELARANHARACEALALARDDSQHAPGPVRADALRAIASRREEARARRASLARALDEANRALEAATEQRDLASRALAEAELRVTAARASVDAAKRHQALEREEHAAEEALEARRRAP